MIRGYFPRTGNTEKAVQDSKSEIINFIIYSFQKESSSAKSKHDKIPRQLTKVVQE